MNKVIPIVPEQDDKLVKTDADPHICPYRSQVNGDDELCTCDEETEYNCSQEI